MFFYELSDEELNLLKHFLTTFLTTKLKPKRSSVIDLSLEMIFYLFQAQGNEGFASEIARYYGHNDKNGHKCYEYIIKKLVKCGFIKVITTKSNFKRILLNKHIRKLLKETLGRVAELRVSGVTGAEIELNLSESSRTARDHRILSKYLHNLSHKSFQRLKGEWSHHHSRCITHEYSDNISDNFSYTVQWFKDKLMIFSPADFDSWENFSKLKSRVETEVARFSKVLERRYDTELVFSETVLMGEEHQVKHELESQDPLSVHVADMFKAEGYSQYQTPHYKFNAEYDGLEYVQGYKHRGVEGCGPTLFTQLLLLPETFLEYTEEYRNTSSLLLQKIQELNQKEERRLDREEQLRKLDRKRDLVLENLVVLLTDKIATKEDIETIREELQKPAAIVTKFARKGEVKELLHGGPKTLEKLAKAMKLTKAGVCYYLKHLEELGEVESAGVEKSGKRGRPKNKYKVVEK